MGFQGFDGVLLATSLMTLGGVVYIVRPAYKQHHLNVFSYLILTLVIFALIVRSMFFLIDIYPEDFVGDKKNPVDGAISAKMFSIIWTYPVINYILAAYVLSGRWVFDLIVLIRPEYNLRVLRR
jgi:hypothetical protein